MLKEIKPALIGYISPSSIIEESFFSTENIMPALRKILSFVSGLDALRILFLF